MKNIFEKAMDIIPTKRNILKTIASIFDPIGFLQNVTINLKILFQEICVQKMEWDEILVEDLRSKWAKIIEQLKVHQDVKIERYYFAGNVNDPVDKIFLHGFSDASELAYAACVYLKFVTKAGFIGVKFMTAKSRIVPAKKTYTIPRLELLGTYILAKLMTSVCEAIKEELILDDVTCWSDSMIALSWIKSVNKELKPFEGNRVAEIKKMVSADKWFHCKTENNPADVITRFHCCDEVKSELYSKGPLFLREINEKQYKRENNVDITSNETNNDSGDVIMGEENVVVNTLNNTIEDLANVDNVICIKNYSNLRKLYRVTAYVLRFIDNMKKAIKKDALILSNYVTLEL